MVQFCDKTMEFPIIHLFTYNLTDDKLIVWKFWWKVAWVHCSRSMVNYEILIFWNTVKCRKFWIWIEMTKLDWKSKSKILFWLWIVNHNPIHQIGLQSRLSNPAIPCLYKYTHYRRSIMYSDWIVVCSFSETLYWLNSLSEDNKSPSDWKSRLLHFILTTR